MKNWHTISSFSKKVDLSLKALRLYEKKGIIKPKIRGENRYRYYTEQQVDLAKRIKVFKTMGFSLEEIKDLLKLNAEIDSTLMIDFLQIRIRNILSQMSCLMDQKIKIENVIKLIEKKKSLTINERKIIMTQLDQILIVVTGKSGLIETAQFIKKHILKSGIDIPIQVWEKQNKEIKPLILVIEEKYLEKFIFERSPDIVVIKDLSTSTMAINEQYLKLYKDAGPHMTTILNADDRAVIELAKEPLIRKGATYYFTKNSGLRDQINKIGGAISDGEEIEIYRYKYSENPLTIKLETIMGVDEEMALIASLVAIMDLGISDQVIWEFSL